MSAQIIKTLRVRQGQRTQKELARELGISAPYLTDLLHGRRSPGPKILEALGLEKRLVKTRTKREESVTH